MTTILQEGVVVKPDAEESIGKQDTKQYDQDDDGYSSRRRAASMSGNTQVYCRVYRA